MALSSQCQWSRRAQYRTVHNRVRYERLAIPSILAVGPVLLSRKAEVDVSPTGRSPRLPRAAQSHAERHDNEHDDVSWWPLCSHFVHLGSDDDAWTIRLKIRAPSTEFTEVAAPDLAELRLAVRFDDRASCFLVRLRTCHTLDLQRQDELPFRRELGRDLTGSDSTGPGLLRTREGRPDKSGARPGLH